MEFVARGAERFEIFQMMRATNRPVLAQARFAVIHFQAHLLAAGAPCAHSFFVGLF